jgi:hypothetical protein
VFFLAGRQAEAVVEYRRALDVNPRSALAWYNTYLAQQQSFHLKESEESLARARDIDGKGIANLLARRGRDGDHAAVVDATVGLGSVWKAALSGEAVRPGASDVTGDGGLKLLWNPLTVASLVALCACFVLPSSGREAARLIRCGRRCFLQEPPRGTILRSRVHLRWTAWLRRPRCARCTKSSATTAGRAACAGFRRCCCRGRLSSCAVAPWPAWCCSWCGWRR